MDNNETSHAYLDSNDAGMSIHSAEGALEHESHALAKEHVNRGVSESDFYPGGYTLRQAFGRLILGDLLRNGEQKVEALADEEDVESVYSFMESGKLYWTHRTIQGSMDNQRFFVTKTGLMGIGHMDTQPGAEVWVFHGGNFPFTIIPREGEREDNYDFGRRCYVQGIMNGWGGLSTWDGTTDAGASLERSV